MWTSQIGSPSRHRDLDLAGCSCWRRAKRAAGRPAFRSLLGGRGACADLLVLVLQRKPALDQARSRRYRDSRLLKSWAMPRFSLPIASILRAWSSSCSSAKVGDVGQRSGELRLVRSPDPQAARLVEEMLVLSVAACQRYSIAQTAWLSSKGGEHPLTVLRMEPFLPQIVGSDCVEAGHRRQVAADEVRPWRAARAAPCKGGSAAT